MVRASLAAVTTANSFSWMLETLLLLYLVTALHLSPAVIGGVLAVGAVGGLAGVILAPRITRVVGFGGQSWRGTALRGSGSRFRPGYVKRGRYHCPDQTRPAAMNTWCCKRILVPGVPPGSRSWTVPPARSMKNMPCVLPLECPGAVTQ
jgi:hypothetical protein